RRTPNSTVERKEGNEHGSDGNHDNLSNGAQADGSGPRDAGVDPSSRRELGRSGARRPQHGDRAFALLRPAGRAGRAVSRASPLWERTQAGGRGLPPPGGEAFAARKRR